MAKEILIINGHDYSRLIESKGYGWSRNDLDTEKTLRTKDGRLRRDKIGTKRKISYTLLNSTREMYAQLDLDLSLDEFSATYLDLHGVMQRIFYCSSFNAKVIEVGENYEIWGAGSFDIIEV